MSNWLSDREMREVTGAEADEYSGPIPTRVVSNGEFNPIPQTRRQKQVEERVAEIGDELGRRVGMNRRDFLKTASGMAVGFLAMNAVPRASAARRSTRARPSPASTAREVWPPPSALPTDSRPASRSS